MDGYTLVISLLYFGVIYAPTLSLDITLFRRLCMPTGNSVGFIKTFPFSDCTDMFYRIPGHVPNSKLVHGSISLQTCKYACLQLPNCVAIDTDLARNTCYVITDVTMLRKRQQVAGFFLYPLLYRCPRPGKHSYTTGMYHMTIIPNNNTSKAARTPRRRAKHVVHFKFFLGIINYPGEVSAHAR